MGLAVSFDECFKRDKQRRGILSNSQSLNWTPLISVSLRISAARPNQTMTTPSELVNIYINIHSGKKIFNIGNPQKKSTLDRYVLF